MKSEFFRGRRWLAALSLATALAVTGFYGLRAAELGKLPFENPAPTIRTSVRSEAAAGRGYSAVVKRVLPGGGQHFHVENGQADGDGNAGRQSIRCSASSSATATATAGIQHAPPAK